jgi:hypothetical protein
MECHPVLDSHLLVANPDRVHKSTDHGFRSNQRSFLLHFRNYCVHRHPAPKNMGKENDHSGDHRLSKHLLDRKAGLANPTAQLAFHDPFPIHPAPVHNILKPFIGE